MKTYIIVPHYIVTEHLVELSSNALKSMRQFSDAHIISVDDCSPMEITYLKDLSDTYIRNDRNSGFAISCNNGFKKAFELSGEEDCFIICANNDIEINKNTITELERPFGMFNGVGITGIISFKFKEVEGKPLDRFTLGRMTHGGLINDWMQDGGLWCSKKSILQDVGLFDEIFIRGGYEDVDLFLRMRDTYGYKIVMNGCAAYYHAQGATRWNCEQNGYINNFGYESKEIEQMNLRKFISKWGFNPHTRQVWKNNELWQY